MDEQPVALAIMARSPNNWESTLRYGVSPQPAQAPENSNSGCRNWVPRTVPKSTRDRSLTGRVSKNAMFSRPAASSGSPAARLIARRLAAPWLAAPWLAAPWLAAPWLAAPWLAAPWLAGTFLARPGAGLARPDTGPAPPPRPQPVPSPR